MRRVNATAICVALGASWLASCGKDTPSSDRDPSYACTTDAECAAAIALDECQRAACSDHLCVAAADLTANGAACDDGRYCTVGETCTDGVCGGGSEPDCSASGDGVCVIGACDESAQGCRGIAAEPPVACDDGDSCTEADLCSGATCAGTAKDCSSLDDPCHAGRCVGGNCEAVPLAGQGCDDGVACTLNDTCNAEGVCAGGWDEASCGCAGDDSCAGLSDGCNTGRCDGPNHVCYADPRIGTDCDDGNPCTTNDQCTTLGACAGSSYTCTAALACQSSTCDGAGTCVVTTLPGFCVIADICYANGQTNPANTCESCAALTSQSEWTAKTDSIPCNADANGCTVDDSCQNGVCTPGAAPTCPSDGKSCTAEVCVSTGPVTYNCSRAANGVGCWIDGACHTDGATNPSNVCEICDVATSATTWSSGAPDVDCGTCRSCDSNGACVVNSTDHDDCGACEKCSSGSCVNQSSLEDLKNECSAHTCYDYVYGWVGTGCRRFAGATPANTGNCTGAGACPTIANSCAGPGALLASCASDSCRTLCPAGAMATSFDTTSEICYEAGEYCEAGVGACVPGGWCDPAYWSCPMLYTWDGTDFAFESDLYPSGYLGLRLGSGYRKPDPNDAYVLRHALTEAGGELELRIVEELDEIDYLDRVRLFAMDVPADRKVVAVANNVPLVYSPVEERVVTLAFQRLPLVSAVHLETGNDVAAVLAASDGNYLVLSEDLNASTWNTLEVDLGDLTGVANLKLVVDGRSRFPNTAAGKLHQQTTNPTGFQTRLEVVDASGQWVEVPRSQVTLVKPKEFPRPMAIDITGIFPTSDHRMRLGWFYKTYLDAIWFDTTPDLEPFVTEVPLLGVTLSRHGFSSTTGNPEIPEYLYSTPRASGHPLGPGAYTRYGDVSPLVGLVDDRFVVFGAGDEVAMRFAPIAPPAPGMRREYVLETAGYYKENIPSEVPFTVAPLPFATMSNFPYPDTEQYPTDAVHQDYLTTWNTRVAP